MKMTIPLKDDVRRRTKRHLVYLMARLRLPALLFSIARLDERLTCKRLSEALILTKKNVLYMSLSPKLQQTLQRLDYLEDEMAILRRLQEEFETGVRALAFDKGKAYTVTVNALFYRLLMRINIRQAEGFVPRLLKKEKKAQILTKLGLVSFPYLRTVARDGRLERLLTKVLREEELLTLVLTRTADVAQERQPIQ